MNTTKLEERRRKYLGPSLSISYRRPLKIVKGYMQYLYDEDGRAYLDAVNNVPHVGHCHPRVVEAGQRQMAILNTNTRYLHDTIVEYAERLVNRFPDPLNVCYFVCSGSEANELAIRMADTFTGGHDIIVIDGAYHGNTTSLINISPYKFNGPGGRGAPDHVHPVPMPDLYRGLYRQGDSDAGARYALHVREILTGLVEPGKQISSFVHESILGCGGQIVLPDGYLHEAYRYTREAGGICIADEVQVGFGRVGSHFWAFQTQGVIPDIVTLGKPMGNGHPLAAVITTPDIANSFANGMEYFNTYGGNPVSCAIGLAVLDVIEEEKLQENADKVGRKLLNEFQQLAVKHDIIGDVRGQGLFVGIEFVKDRTSLAPAAELANQVVEEAKDRGILLSTDGPLHNVVKIKPPLVFNEENAEFLINTIDEAIVSLGF